MSNTKDEIPTIDPGQLAAVTGGASSDDAVTQMLTQLMSSIQDLAKNASQSNQNPMMMLLPMMMMMHQREQAPVQAAPEPPPGDGWVRVA
ncbi:MAG: hypothetical protein JO257_02160 [Deltaproteobacteria bacterium]|nr:hypothetical protein [Deltaproteobacteria bacterium]